MVLAFYRAPLAAVSERLSPYSNAPPGSPPQGIVSRIFQFDDSEWTGFFFDVSLIDALHKMSSDLNAEGVLFIHDDTSSWTALHVVQNGKVAEEYRFGFDDDPDTQSGDSSNVPLGWDLVTRDSHGWQYLFRSTLRQTTEHEMKNDRQFFDQVCRARQLWCPDWKTLEQLPKVPGAECVERTFYW
jgi:hypothetical protein